jgi:hypothetical protein
MLFYVSLVFLFLYIYSFLYLINIKSAIILLIINFALFLYLPFVKIQQNRRLIASLIVLNLCIQSLILYKYNKVASWLVLPYTIVFAYQNIL